MIGIDFGTSTTEVAVMRDEPVVLASPEGDEVMPSVVAYLPGERVAVGSRAAARRIIDPANTIHSVKRILGLGWFDETVADYRKQAAFEMIEGPRGEPRFNTRAGDVSADDVAREVFKHLAEYTHVRTSDSTVVTVPASFESAQRVAITTVALEAGFTDVTVLDEPFAAALPYLRDEGRSPGETIAVYDLGGGTFDVAVLRLRGVSQRILASGGDAYLGGDDLDRVLAERLVNRILEQHQWDVSTSKTSMHKLVAQSQKAKERLSTAPEVRVALDLVDTVLAGKDVMVGRAELDEAIRGLIQSTFLICDEVFARAGLRPQEVDAVVLAGGSTRIPFVREAAASYFGKPALDVGLAPELLVSTGAAIWASRSGR